MEGVYSEVGGGVGVFVDVVDEHSFVRHGADFAECVVKNCGGGLARPHAAGVDANGEVPDERKSCFEMGHMNGVGI